MSLSVGIVGLPNVGKSTLFNAITRKQVDAQNYPFCTIDPSVGVVPVPDARLDALNELSHSEKKIPAVVEFVDIAGLVKGASEGEGLGNQFLANIREVDAIAQVVRIFENDSIIHVEGKIDPLADIEVINLELILADTQTVSRRLERVAKDVKRGDKEAVLEQQVLLKVKSELDGGKLASNAALTEKELPILKTLHLLTTKPVLYVLNKEAGGNNLDETNDSRFVVLTKYFKENNMKYVLVDAKIEHELSDYDAEEKKTLKEELTVSDDGIDELINASYELLGLITYFTTGPTETRAWTIKRDSSAPEAGAAIHTDFREKFIRAEVVFWSDLVDAGSLAKAREKGLVRTEGKEYVVIDGDVIEFKV